MPITTDPRLDPRISRDFSRLPPGVDDRNPQQVEQRGSPGRLLRHGRSMGEWTGT